MKRVLRRPKTWLVILLILLLAPFIYSYVMMNEFMWSREEIEVYFKSKNAKPVFSHYSINGRVVSYSTIGSDTLPPVIFVHGAPGSWSDYIKYFGDENLISKAQLLALDRPGYGNSGLGKAMTSIEEQTAILKPLLALNKSGKPAVLIGHSYGGPIVVRFAMDYPEDVKALILLAPAIDPDNEKMFWVNKPASWKVVQTIIPKMMLTAQMEKVSHVSELRKMENSWGKITATTIYMFGDKDSLVPPVNVEYAKKKITNAKLEVTVFPKEDHFIPWSQQDSVTKIILRCIAD